MEPCTFGSAKGLVVGDKNAPGVILLQEWWGITENLKTLATTLAGKGFRVLIPDLYNGIVGHDKEEASHLMSNLDWAVAAKQIGEAAAFLKAGGCPKVGATGFCMGGALALVGLASSDDISAAAPFYGTPQPGRIDYKALQAGFPSKKPVQGHFGALDQSMGFSDVATAKALEAAMEGRCELFIYEGQGHAFMNPTPEPFATFEERQAALGQVPYDPKVGELAMSRVESFFKKHLTA